MSLVRYSVSVMGVVGVSVGVGMSVCLNGIRGAITCELKRYDYCDPA